MPEVKLYNDHSARHSDDMQDIITTVPSWLLRWGTTLFFAVLVLILGLSAVIRYPDIVKAQLKIEPLSPLEPVTPKMSVKLINVLVMQNEMVKAEQPLALLEGETNHIKFILTAPQAGQIKFDGILREKHVYFSNQTMFYIFSGNNDFFGEMAIPQNNMGKIREGQKVLIKLKSYPFEEYGIIRGKISYIAEVPFRDSVFLAKVDFKIKNSSDLRRTVRLKQGMLADAEIITQDATVLQRIYRSLKIIDNNN